MTLRLLAATTVVVNAAGAAVALSRRLPAEFGRGVLGRLALHGRPERVGREFLTWRGTAIAPPLPLLAVLAALTRAEGRPSAASAKAIAALGAVGTVGHLGEPVTWHAVRRRAPLLPAALGLASLALYGSMAVLGTVEARRRG